MVYTYHWYHWIEEHSNQFILPHWKIGQMKEQSLWNVFDDVQVHRSYGHTEWLRRATITAKRHPFIVCNSRRDRQIILCHHCGLCHNCEAIVLQPSSEFHVIWQNIKMCRLPNKCHYRTALIYDAYWHNEHCDFLSVHTMERWLYRTNKN